MLEWWKAQLELLREAVRQLPELVYLLSAAAVGAAAGLIVLSLGNGLEAIWKWSLTFLAFVLVFVFVTYIRAPNGAMRAPGAALIVLALAVLAFLLLIGGARLIGIEPRAWAPPAAPPAATTVTRRGDLVSVGCERGNRSTTTYTVPDGFTIANAQPDTADVNDAKHKSAAMSRSADGRTLTAVADFHGRDREWTGNCPSGGQGRVVLTVEILPIPPAPSLSWWIWFGGGLGLIGLLALIVASSLGGGPGGRGSRGPRRRRAAKSSAAA